MTITIIAVMAALLSPALKTAKDRAKLVKCMSNLRGIGLGITLYASDYRVFPYKTHYLDTCHWYELIIPQMHPGNYTRLTATGPDSIIWRKDGVTVDQTYGKNVFPYYQCPAAPRPATTKYGHHYACNGLLLVETHVGGEPMPPQNPWDVIDSRPGDIILAADSASNSTGDNHSSMDLGLMTGPIANDFSSDPTGAPTRGATPATTAAIYNAEPIAGGSASPIYTRHNGVCPAVMADGHVQVFKNGEMQRRNFAARARAYSWGGGAWVDVNYP